MQLIYELLTMYMYIKFGRADVRDNSSLPMPVLQPFGLVVVS